MKTIIITLLLVTLATAQAPIPSYKDACLAFEKDPVQGNIDCLYCYGYNVLPGTARCDTKNQANCIFSLQLPGFPKSYCNLCNKGFAANLNDGTCPSVAPADVVENCDYYWIPPKTTSAKCMGCSKGYVAQFTKQATLDIGCFKNDPLLIANCDSMVINEFKKSHHETITQINCQICADGFTLYQKIKATGLFKDIVTSQCIPQTGHFQGCAVHNRQYNLLGELEDSYCAMCDPRGSYKAHGEISKFKNGDKMCKKID